MMIAASALVYVISFATSILLHPIVYKDGASTFSKLRGAPAIGTALAMLAVLGNLKLLRLRNRDSDEGDFLAVLSAFVSVGAGVMAADLWRGMRADIDKRG